MSQMNFTEERKRELLAWASAWEKSRRGRPMARRGGRGDALGRNGGLAVQAQRAFAKEMCEELTSRQAQQPPKTTPCPVCGRECWIERLDEEQEKRTRRIQTRSGPFDLVEPRNVLPALSPVFFRSTGGVGINGHSYSPSIVLKIVRAGADR
ncbi:MAG: hypothetical protein GXP27_19630 [Planctomycetes bacterium]|nr:hypothetical protein [Planctomycetota bacterium]